jgi:hypothetical protein
MKIITRNINGVLLIILTISLSFLNSCDLDQREDKYSDFDSANEDELFKKGWIPANLAFKSMTDIYQRTNLDLNTCVFSFKLSKTDIETVKQKARPTKTIFEAPRRIKISSEWSKAVEKLEHYIYTTNDKRDSVYLAIDDQERIVYGWRN